MQPGDAGLDGCIHVFGADTQHPVHLAKIDGNPAANRIDVAFEEVPAPKGMTGTWCAALIVKIAETSSVLSGEADDIRRGRRVIRLIVAMLRRTAAATLRVRPAAP